MYLKKIVATGFKSFADKITIDLNNGITGIVGPNGSGKSNVVDAVRWVLGEQSVKSLRGDGNMSDVIFSGSKSRKPLNVASVTLIFDNSDKYLPLDYLEVSIRRRVYRDGTNEYSINDEKCRLKDITDLLLDTGIAKESFNIISQGKVEEIISSKPTDRRVIFEEAAGVLKYKKRKDEALRKLEKTHDNMSRVNDIINELEIQVNPLKEQRDKALIYKEKSSELEKIEVSLITSEITNINYKYKENKEQVEKLTEELLKSETLNNTSSAKIENYKLEITKLDNQINQKQTELTNKVAEVEKINSKKNILIERQKYNVEDIKLHDNIVNLKEQELKIKNEIEKIKQEIKTQEENLNEQISDLSKIEKELIQIKKNKDEIEKKLNFKYLEKTKLDNKINYLKDVIENNSSLPESVRSILNNPKLIGIHNTIGNLIEVDEKYSIAITTSLAGATNNIIVDDENKAKDAINYLKSNHLGRVTFFPLNIIKSRMLKQDILNEIKNMNGFIDVASNLVKYQPIYKNIIENQLGNVLIADNIDNANIISKKINHMYKIVTLDGSLLHVGGSLTGGSLSKRNNIITDKYELETSIKNLDKVVLEIKDIENNINELDYKYKNLENKFYVINKDKIMIQDSISSKKIALSDKEKQSIDITNEIDGTNKVLNNDLYNEETKVLEEYYNVLKEKEILEESLTRLKNKKMNLNNDLTEFEFSVKQENSIYNTKSKQLKDLEIEVNRMDVKLDNLLNRLNETYSMTYEKAVTLYKLEIDIDEARSKVNNLKRTIKELGNVNLDSIDEYERVNERYEFLNNQKDDLIKAEDTLLEIIEEMDFVMEDEFEKSFKKINESFKETFKELFKGGNAELKLTDPKDILETGIEIVASPPGKSLKSISLLSGGEKTFTAISLLFAILKSRSVPFCILDEVEAALDEVNVDGFGEYITRLKEKTQFILITHKKRTMEYADILYGITMQESGVSKLVSVKLEDFNEK